MQNENLTRLIIDTSDLLNLDETIVEKDYYVTQVLRTLSDIENEFFRLVFAGGTCLAKAHKIVNRMSEDIDFKIQLKNTSANFSNSRILKELKVFRELINAKLEIPGLIINPPQVRNEGKYTRIEISYPHAFAGINPSLRPDILLELTQANIKLATENVTIKTIIDETFEEKNLLPPFLTPCISIEETAIEKWVGLTRRVIAAERNKDFKDDNLVRHVYDLYCIRQANKIDNTFFQLAKGVVIEDMKQFGNQHPEYAINPISEIRQSLGLLKNKVEWKENYLMFIEGMAFEPHTSPDYEKALMVVEQLSDKVIDLL